MQSFKIGDGQEFRFKLTVGRAEAVKDLVGFDLFQVEGELLRSLSLKPLELMRVLWELRCEVGAPAMSREAFFEAMSGDDLDSAREKLLEEVIAFYPKALRPSIRAAILKFNQEVEAMATAAAPAGSPT